MQETITTEALFAQHVIPNYGRLSLAIDRGCGVRVWDEAGREYLDFGAGIAVCSLGHSPKVLVDAIATQAAKLIHTSNLYQIRAQAELAARINRLVGCAGKSFFCNSGAEANEALFKLARKYGSEQRGGAFEVITFQNSFHGRTLAAIAATGQDKVRKGFGPLMPGFVHLPFNDLEAVKAAVTEKTAAILLEPIQGEGGIAVATAEFLHGLRDLADETGVLLMFDEVQCGFGRTGEWCAWKSITGAGTLEADAISWAKGIAGGFPMGAIWVRDRKVGGEEHESLCDVLGPGSHGTTFGGTPLACAAATAVLGEIENADLLSAAKKLGEKLRAGLKALGSPLVTEVRGLGLMVGFELDVAAFCEATGVAASSRAASLQMVDHLQAAGMLVVPSGLAVVRLLPPLNVTEAEIGEALERIGGVLGSLMKTAD